MRVAASILILLAVGCGPKTPPTQISGGTQNRIALCTAGYAVNAAREIRAEASLREGSFITTEETQERGVDTFAFGEHRGETAVAMYNAYVECISLVEAEGGPRLYDRARHQVGITKGGDPVIQIPMPGEERVGEEIQLHILTDDGVSWRSDGYPQWEGWCSGGSGIHEIGNRSSYVYRFFTDGQGECAITLRALQTRSSQFEHWHQVYHVQIRKERRR